MVAKICSVYGARKGTGQTQISANIGALLALKGKKVAMIDCNFAYPSVHTAFNVSKENVQYTMNDYIEGKCAITDVATEQLLRYATPKMQLAPFWICPSRQSYKMLTPATQKFNARFIYQACEEIIRAYKLDFVFLDLPNGYEETTLVAHSFCDEVIMLMTLDQLNIESTLRMAAVGKRLNWPKPRMLVNQIATSMLEEYPYLREDVQNIIGNYDIWGMLPTESKLPVLLSGEKTVLALHYPEHPIIKALDELIDNLLTHCPSPDAS